MASRVPRVLPVNRLTRRDQPGRAVPHAVVDAARPLGQVDVVAEVVRQLGQRRPHPLAPGATAGDRGGQRLVDGRDRVAQLTAVGPHPLDVCREVGVHGTSRPHRPATASGGVHLAASLSA